MLLHTDSVRKCFQYMVTIFYITENSDYALKTFALQTFANAVCALQTFANVFSS